MCSCSLLHTYMRTLAYLSSTLLPQNLLMLSGYVCALILFYGRVENKDQIRFVKFYANEGLWLSSIECQKMCVLTSLDTRRDE